MRRLSQRRSLCGTLFLACTICNFVLADLDAERNKKYPVISREEAPVDAEAAGALTTASKFGRMLKEKSGEKHHKDSKKDQKKKDSKKEKNSKQKDKHDKDSKKTVKHEKDSKKKEDKKKEDKKTGGKKKDDWEKQSTSRKDSKSSAASSKLYAPVPKFFSLIAKTVNTTACYGALKPQPIKPATKASFTRTELTAMLSRSTEATSLALQQADTSCVLHIESVSPARVCVSAVSLNATSNAPVCVQETEGALVTDRGPLGSQLRRPMLCTVANSRLRTSSVQAGLEGSSMGRAPEERAAIVTSAFSSTQLIFGEGTWLSFLNKLSFCEKTGRHLYLWLSPADWSPEPSRPSMSPTPFPASSSWEPQCNLHMAPAGRSVKPLAVLAALQHAPALPAALFMELDVWFGDGVNAAVGNGTVSLEDYLALAPDASLVLAQSDYDKEAWCTGNVELLSTTAFFARQSTLSQGLLSAWFDLRCGIHDENPLLQLLLASIVATRNLVLTFEWRNLANYEEYNQNAIQTIGRQLESILKESRSRWRGNLAFQMTGQLHAPLELPPGVLLLPTAPVSVTTATTLPAFLAKGEADLPTYVCEGKSSGSHIPTCSMESKCVGPGGPKERCSVTLMKSGDWGMQ